MTVNSGNVVRFASYAFLKQWHSCPLMTRKFTTTINNRLSSKRKLVTTTAYRPHTLDTMPPPPRNLSITESSVARGIPQVNDIRPPPISNLGILSTSQANAQPNTKVSGNEDHHSKVASETSQAPPPIQDIPVAKRSQLRPRKAAISLTQTAISHLRDLLAMPEPKLIRVGVRNRGCSGLAYHLDYVEKPGMFDETVEQDGVKVLIDSKALFSIIGSEMDWVEDQLNQRFVFRNPNISKPSLRLLSNLSD